MKTKKLNTKMVSLKLPMQLIERLKEVASEKGISVSELIRRILDEQV